MTTPFSAPKNQQLTFSAVLLRILVLTDWTIYFLCLKHYDTVQCHFGRVEKGTKWLQQLCHTHLLLTMAFINCSSLLRRIFHFSIHLHGNRVYCHVCFLWLVNHVLHALSLCFQYLYLSISSSKPRPNLPKIVIIIPLQKADVKTLCLFSINRGGI